MDIKTYRALIRLLDEAGLTTERGTPDFDKIAEITGHTRDTVKVYLAPSADFPRWLNLLNYVGEKLRKYKLTEDDIIESYTDYLSNEGKEFTIDVIAIKWVMSLLDGFGLMKDCSATKENTEVTC